MAERAADIVAVAEPVVSLLPPPTGSISNVVDSELAEYLLQNQGYPLGLAKELEHSKLTYPLRFWIVDNSGSMMTADGRELTGSNRQCLAVVKCTRWQELQSTIEYHIGLANMLGAHTIFRLLNRPSAGSGNNYLAQEFSIADHGVPSDEATVANALHIIQSTLPAGVTPLTSHLQAITTRIQQVAPTLIEQSQKAVVVIATDGLPTDPLGNVNDDVKGDFVSALKLLQAQPVWIVIRLCTQNPEVVEFYNGLDMELEAPLEVLDDFLGEATEIVKLNKWLKYVVSFCLLWSWMMLCILLAGWPFVSRSHDPLAVLLHPTPTATRCHCTGAGRPDTIIVCLISSTKAGSITISSDRSCRSCSDATTFPIRSLIGRNLSARWKK
jgi:hypothetical protein